MKNFSGKKVALVHDFLLYYGGAEAVLKNMVKMFPDAPIYTLLKNENVFNQGESEINRIQDKKIQESFLKKFPAFLKKRHRFLLPFMPTAVENFDLRNYDWVITSSGAFSKGIVVKSNIKHICYMHSPMRYLWDQNHEYLQKKYLKGKSKIITRLFLNYLRMWDRASAQRPDYLIANSSYTASRIWKYYRREATVIYPPVKMDDINVCSTNEGYFLTVCRLSDYKKVDILIDAFDKLGLPLVIAGTGEKKKELSKKIQKECVNPDKIKITGWLGRKELVEKYQNARAFVFASEEDFGIAPVEAMAAGKPVIAYKKGGALETVKEGESGEFFKHCQVEIIADAVRRFIEKEKTYDCHKIRKNAERFREEKFKEKFKSYLSKIN